HEQEREGFTNVYLDDVEPLEPRDSAAGDDRETDEVAWKTAMEAAPYLVGPETGEREISPRDLFAKLKPFKELVAEDIEQNGGGYPESQSSLSWNESPSGSSAGRVSTGATASRRSRNLVTAWNARGFASCSVNRRSIVSAPRSPMPRRYCCSRVSRCERTSST